MRSVLIELALAQAGHRAVIDAMTGYGFAANVPPAPAASDGDDEAPHTRNVVFRRP